MSAQNIGDWDEVYGFFGRVIHLNRITQDELWEGDWTKGPAGTNDTDWTVTGLERWDLKAGAVAESWDISKPTEIRWNIRKGIKWGMNPKYEASRLVNNRELTADDVVFSLKQQITNPRAYIYTSNPELRTVEISAPDKYTVIWKLPEPEKQYEQAIMRFGESCHIVPKEVVDKYGSMQDWRTMVGTGPYMMEDWVDNSSAQLIKNQTFWQKDPIGAGKGNQLPYIDAVKVLIIPDTSTADAAFRTGKVDARGADWETKNNLVKQSPQLLFRQFYGDGGFHTNWRTDKAPFSDKRVRRALLMAIDFKTLVSSLFGGNAQIITWPVIYNPGYKNAFLGLDDPQCPASVKELYTYNPTKAKQLLTEAGFPNGFKTNVICNSSTAGSPNQVDYFSVIKEMWSKVGVDLTIDAKETVVWNNIWSARNYDQIMHGSIGGWGVAFTAINYKGGGSTNGSYVGPDAVVDEAVAKMQKAVLAGGQAAQDPIHKELMKYVLDQAWAIPFPSAGSYNMWWPYLKNYHGETGIGRYNNWNWSKYAWVDQDLKAKLLGK
jgi:peptide/nickel transport system substrate-binding protein